MKKFERGFTIVELLIVIIVIAILAAITVVAYNGVQDRSKQSKIQADISNISKAIRLAQVSKSQAFKDITGNNATGNSCWTKPDGTDLASLATSDACVATYISTMNLISSASGVQGLANLRDPWGRPYLIDENEAEGSATNCTKDTVAVFKQPFTTGFGAYSTTPINNLPLSGFTSC